MKPPKFTLLTSAHMFVLTFHQLYLALAQEKMEPTCSPCTCAGKTMLCRKTSYIPPLPTKITEIVITDTNLKSGRDFFKNLENATLRSLTFKESAFIGDLEFPFNLSHLESLTLADTQVTEDGFFNLAEATIDSTLRIFNITNPPDPGVITGGLSLLLADQTVLHLTMENAAIKSFKAFIAPQYLSLNLPNNAIESWPEELLQIAKSLEQLDLTGNRIQRIEEYSFAGEFLQKLILRDNMCDFSLSSDTIFSHTPLLLQLDISGNYLGLMKPENLSVLFASNLTKLEMLSLKNTGIFHLPEGIFTKIPMLKSLDLSENEIGWWPSDVFSRMPRLNFLDMSSNAISVLNETSFPVTDASMDLSSNPFLCTCALLWFRRTAPSLGTNLLGYPNSYRCARPSSMAGEPVSSLDMETCEQGARNPKKAVIISGVVGCLIILIVVVAAVYFFSKPLLRKWRLNAELTPYYRMHPTQ